MLILSRGLSLWLVYYGGAAVAGLGKLPGGGVRPKLNSTPVMGILESHIARRVWGPKELHTVPQWPAGFAVTPTYGPNTDRLTLYERK